jgi:hypothetical protein
VSIGRDRERGPVKGYVRHVCIILLFSFMAFYIHNDFFPNLKYSGHVIVTDTCILCFVNQKICFVSITDASDADPSRFFRIRIRPDR